MGGGPPAPSTSSTTAARARPPVRAASEMAIESSLLNGSGERAGGRGYRPVFIDERQIHLTPALGEGSRYFTDSRLPGPCAIVTDEDGRRTGPSRGGDRR